MLHFAAPVDEDADLAANIVTDLCQVSRELMGDQPVPTQLTAKEPLELLDLAGLEAAGVAVDLDERVLQRPWSGRAGGERWAVCSRAGAGRKVGAARSRGKISQWPNSCQKDPF